MALAIPNGAIGKQASQGDARQRIDLYQHHVVAMNQFRLIDVA